MELSDEQAMFKYSSAFEQLMDIGDTVVLLPQRMFQRKLTIKSKVIHTDALVALIYTSSWTLKDCVLFSTAQLTKKSFGVYKERLQEFGTESMRVIPKLSKNGFLIPSESASTPMISQGNLDVVKVKVGNDRHHVYITTLQAFTKREVRAHCFPQFASDTPGVYFRMKDDYIVLERKNCSMFDKVDFNPVYLPTEHIDLDPVPEMYMNLNQFDVDTRGANADPIRSSGIAPADDGIAKKPRVRKPKAGTATA